MSPTLKAKHSLLCRCLSTLGVLGLVQNYLTLVPGAAVCNQSTDLKSWAFIGQLTLFQHSLLQNVTATISNSLQLI